ncbi:hypothetical protein GCM10011512_12900 [Tersicoccus solisilvae]|uniref:Uncharacterized protein n=1 Tax=Tersicoccus solisilvae TaxID=1882339 RepID=A0ABQ1NXZ5_9MICC|nr:hypothetical protein [Tersicoccus solisilvae]GGC87384.1 hypothetical protein GCM10011512_12900 [Tersicoccus solisilvae]
MDIQNHYYGHSAVLARHCGLPRVRHVAGLIQHGWTVTSPVRAQFGDFAGWGPSRRRLSWTSTSRAWSPEDPESRFADGSPMLDAIGAPYLYLLRQAQQADALPAREDRTLVLPMHGTALLKVAGDHAAYAAQVREKEGSATVSLHIDDLQNETIVRAWEGAGHHIVSSGERRDPRFIARVLYLMASSRRVVSNRLSTSVMYGAVTGADVAVYGPDYALGANPDVDPGLQMRRWWPEFHEENPDQDQLRRIAGEELGAGDVREPADLKRLLGWDGPTTRPFVEYWASGPWAKAQAVLGWKARHEGAHETEVGLSPWHWIRHPFQHLPSPLPRIPKDLVSEPIRH